MEKNPFDASALSYIGREADPLLKAVDVLSS